MSKPGPPVTIPSMVNRIPSLPPKKFGYDPLRLVSARPSGLSTSASKASAHSHSNASFTLARGESSSPAHPKRKSLPTTATLASPTKRKASLDPVRKSRSKTSSQPVNTKQLRNDRLGTLVRKLCSAFDKADSWDTFVKDFRGPSYLSENLEDADHPAIDLLRQWRDRGVPVNTESEPWSYEQKDSCIQRGCHQSANEHSDFLREEMAEFIENRFWVVLPYDVVRDLEQLMLWPAALKEERERKPRLLCDHSWPWGWPSLNESTLHHAPPEAMQFGATLPRILYHIRHSNPKFGPPKSCKLDVKDSFYRLFLQARDCPKKALILPLYEGEPQLVALPMACTMGWVQSPPTFCTMSETVCDLANARIAASSTQCPPHRLESPAAEGDDLSPSFEPRPRGEADRLGDLALEDVACGAPLPEPEPDHQAPPSNRPFQRPLAHTDVFVDDFIQLGQGGPKRMRAMRRHLLWAVDAILATPDVSDTQRNEAVSLKKLLKGDGAWETRKLLLGWIVDTVRQTIELPPHRKAELAQIFADLATTSRVSQRKWQSYLGKLRFVSVAIPGSAGLFSALQLALNAAHGNRIRITKSLRHHVRAFAALAASLRHRPTHLAEIVPEEPAILGTTDAAKAGMGGVFFDHENNPHVWRYPFPTDIQQNMVSTDNPDGTVTNSDFEHAGMLAQVSLIATTHDVTYSTVMTGSDNTPAVSRISRGAVSNDRADARLCHYQCQHQRMHRYCHQGFFLPGKANVMGDDASRLQQLTDAAFLAHFEQHYPQDKPWRLLHLPSEISSPLISALRSESPLPLPPPRRGRPKPKSWGIGKPSATRSVATSPSVMSWASTNASPTSWSTDCATAREDRPTTLSDLLLLAKPSRPSGRGSPTWVSRIHDSTRLQESSIPYSLLSSSPWKTKTTRAAGPTRPTSPSCEPCPKPSTPSMRNMASSTPTSSISSSSLSGGSSDPPSTCTRPRRKLALRPSNSSTSISPSAGPSTTPSTHL